MHTGPFMKTVLHLNETNGEHPIFHNMNLKQKWQSFGKGDALWDEKHCCHYHWEGGGRLSLTGDPKELEML